MQKIETNYYTPKYLRLNRLGIDTPTFDGSFRLREIKQLHTVRHPELRGECLGYILRCIGLEPFLPR